MLGLEPWTALKKGERGSDVQRWSLNKALRLVVSTTGCEALNAKRRIGNIQKGLGSV